MHRPGDGYTITSPVPQDLEVERCRCACWRDNWPAGICGSSARASRRPGAPRKLVADASRAGRIAQAFRPPLRFAQVHTAGFYDDAGFCEDCDAP